MVAVAYPGVGVPSVGRRRPRRPAAVYPQQARRATAACYRRRRMGVGSLALTMLLAGWAAVGSQGGGPLSAPEPTSMLVAEHGYVVQPGDTLWTIARRLQPEGDVRRLVDRLAAQHRGSPLQVGERISLP